MKRITLSLFALALACLNLSAQTDVTKYLLENYGFDTDFDYPASSSATVTQEIKAVKGWTPELTADFTITGVYEFGFGGKFNAATVPATGYENSAGGALALSTGWSQTFCYSQSVTLPAGTYTVKVPTYNGDASATAGTSKLAWIPNSGTAVESSVASYPAHEWTLDQITFTLTATTGGKLRIGFLSAGGGSANSAKLLIDYVQVLAENMQVDKTQLKAGLDLATSLYGSGDGVGAADLKAAIDAAKGVDDDASADMLAVLGAQKALSAAVAAYRMKNVSEENPLDCTSYIQNPSFETKGTDKWTSSNLASQGNSAFTKKAGSTYVEKWVGSGNRVGDASISQVVALPMGKYKLTVAAQNYNQAATTQKCTGAYIYADGDQTPVYTPDDYSVMFTNISGEVEIGFVAKAATGNWLAVDNFRLYQIGEVNTGDVVTELQSRAATAEALTASMMSNTAKEKLRTAIDAAKQITAASEETTIQTAAKNLTAVVAEAQASIDEFAALQQAINSMEQDYDAGKNGAADFRAEIDKAKALAQNGDATSDELTDEIAALETAQLLFFVANGSGAAPVVTTNTSFYIPAAHGGLVRAAFTGSIKQRGICWSTDPNPTIADNRETTSYSLKGTILHIKGMKPASVYYARPYAIGNNYAVGYGEAIKVVTLPLGSCVGTWNEGAPTEEANARCRNAIAETIDYLNEWTAIKGFRLTGNYGAQTPTADCSYGGWMRIGPNAGNQAIGTVIHETGHGVGVGTHWRWYSCADTRENTTHGKWLGSWANKTLRFLENTTSEATFMTGDGTHGWGANASYDWFVNGADKDKHTAIQYIGGCALLYALYIDGLCPTTGYPNGVPGYTFNFDDNKKYYIKGESEDFGLVDGFVCHTKTGLRWKKYDVSELNDSAAWYVEYVPSTGYYRLRNAATGYYISHSGTTPVMKKTASPTTGENFQLMPGRKDVAIGTGADAFAAQTYWFTWGGDQSMVLSTYLDRRDYGLVQTAAFSYSNAATAQRYFFVSEDELDALNTAVVAVGIDRIAADGAAGDGQRAVEGIYTADGARLEQARPGINIIRYSDGTAEKVYVK